MIVWEFLKDVGIAGVLDILFMSILIYSALVLFKRTRTAFVVGGMFVIAAVYVLSRLLGMNLTTSALQGFFGVIFIAVIVIFQEEIKQFFERVANPSLVRRLYPFGRAGVPAPETEVLVRTLGELARLKVGALVVVRGRDPIARHLEGGVELDGKLSEGLLRSLFDPHSPGHDGAVVVEGGRVSQYGAHLPLSKNFAQLQGMGTRHAAALGLAEVCDALCVVASEERGRISIARRGTLRPVADAEELGRALGGFLTEVAPPRTMSFWQDLVRKNFKEKLIAFAVTALMWFLLVHESKRVYRSYVVAVDPAVPEEAWKVVFVEPREVQLTLHGPRRSMYFLSRRGLRLSVQMHDLHPGDLVRPLTASGLSLPEGVLVGEIVPKEVTVRLERRDNR